MLDEGFLPPPPYHLVDNADSWLDKTDLVFVDPVGTGYSRAVSPEEGKKVWGLQGDIASVGEFIRLYLTRYERWTSPLFLAGESYGTTRAAGLSGYLVDHGIALNGVVLISTILNFQTADYARGNDLPYILYVPTYTATAWYHKKLPPDLQKQDLPQVLAEAEKWASTDYTIALQKGTRLTAQERQQTIAQLARYTGLSETFIDDSDLRLTLDRFDAELLRDRKLTVGRLDSRFTGASDLPGSESPDFDPSMTAIRPPYTAMLYDYVRTELGFKSDLRYYILGGGFTSWDFGSDNQYADVSGALWSAFAKNPYMKLFVAMGYYDQATPVLRGGVHAGPPAAAGRVAGQRQHRALSRRPHGLHRQGIAGEAEAGRRRVHGPRDRREAAVGERAAAQYRLRATVSSGRKLAVRARSLKPAALPSLQPPQFPPFALVRGPRRRHRRAVDPLEPPHLDFLRRGRRRQILVERAGFLSRQVLLGELAHDDRLLASHGARNDQAIAGTDRAMRLAGLAVDGDLAALAGLLGFRSRPEQTGDVEPDVEPDVCRVGSLRAARLVMHRAL